MKRHCVSVEWRSEMCRSCGILKEKKKKCSVTKIKTLGYSLVLKKKKKTLEILKAYCILNEITDTCDFVCELTVQWDDVSAPGAVSKHVPSIQRKCPFVFFAGPTYTLSPTGPLLWNCINLLKESHSSSSSAQLSTNTFVILSFPLSRSPFIRAADSVWVGECWFVFL